VFWVVAISLLVLVAAAAMRRRAKRSATARDMPNLSPPPDFDTSDSLRPEKRVQQFRMTSSHQTLEEAITDPRDLRSDTQAQLEEGEIAQDMATLDAFLADVRDSLGADEAVYWRWSRARDTLTPGAWSTPNAQRPQFFDMGAWGALVKWAAEGRVLSFDADARVAVTRLAVAPVELDGRLIGVLSVARAEGLERGREHLKQWLPRHAAQVGRLVSLFEVRLQMGRHMRHSKALLRAAQLVQGHKSQEALNKAICETTLQVTSATEAALVRWRGDEDKGWVQFATAGLQQKAPFPLGEDSLVARTCRDGTMLVHDDVAKMSGPMSLFFENDEAWTKGALAIVPLALEGRVIGAIVATAPPKVIIPSEEARNIALLGAIAATSLEMVWEIEEVSRRARTDALTGLANRRAFDEHLGQLLAHADRFGHSLSLVLADVDHFKKVNDTWGHEAGDVVLKHIASTLQDGVRAVDICARFGGEEIALLLPQTALPGASELADRLRAAVADRPVNWGGNEIPVTISCGVACYPDGVLTKEALFAAADRALYEAKSAGRNCVKSAIPKPTGVAR
jgi:diguanylate cyclase (GGDEF)-like protein